VATLSFYEKEPVLRKKQTERGSELSFYEKEPVLTKKETKGKGKREKSGRRRSKRSELASGVKFKSKANYSIPAGIHGCFSGIFSGMVLHRGVLSGRYFLLCKTHFARDGLYPFTNISGEFIGCVFSEF